MASALPLPANQAPVDRYTIGHVAWGTMLGLARVPWWGALGSTLLFELVLEDRWKQLCPGVFPVPTKDSGANRTIDSIAVMLGWWLMYRMPPPEPRVALPR